MTILRVRLASHNCFLPHRPGKLPRREKTLRDFLQFNNPLTNQRVSLMVANSSTAILMVIATGLWRGLYGQRLGTAEVAKAGPQVAKGLSLFCGSIV
jgi:hypothetical protein